MANSTGIGKVKDAALASKNAVLGAVDLNGDGCLDIEDLILAGLKTPGIKVKREEFLRKEFFKNHPKSVIDEIVRTNPATAGISRKEVEKIADEVVKYERNLVTGIAAVLSSAGGLTMMVTIPTDIAQYYGYLLRATQKLLYLYGFPDLNIAGKQRQFDSETINVLTVCMGIMYGAAGANNAIKAMANALGKGVEEQLLKTALTQGAIYPIVTDVAKWFGQQMTKEIFAEFFKKSIPVVGSAIGGGLTYLAFGPCCEKLRASLRDTMLSNPNYEMTDEEKEMVVSIEEYRARHAMERRSTS